MQPESHEPPLAAAQSLLRAHTHVVGGTGSGKASPRLAPLGIHRIDTGDNSERSFFASISAERLAEFPADFEAPPLSEKPETPGSPG